MPEITNGYLRKRIKKLLLKIIGNDIYQPEQVEMKKMQDWLFHCYQNDGWKHYYTMRKKYLVNLLALGIKDEEQAKAVGRLEELKSLAANINTEAKNRKIK